MCGWGGVRTSSRSSASSSETRVDYRIRESADTVPASSSVRLETAVESFRAGSTAKCLGLRNPGTVESQQRFRIRELRGEMVMGCQPFKFPSTQPSTSPVTIDSGHDRP